VTGSAFESCSSSGSAPGSLLQVYGTSARINIIGCSFTMINGTKGALEVHQAIPNTFVFVNNSFSSVNATNGNGGVLIITPSSGSITIDGCIFLNCRSSANGG
jgi:hypothetical protein